MQINAFPNGRLQTTLRKSNPLFLVQRPIISQNLYSKIRNVDKQWIKSV